MYFPQLNVVCDIAFSVQQLAQRLVQVLRNTLTDDAIISLDNGIYKIWFARNYPCYDPNTLLLDNALASMDAGLSGAMMATILYPDTQVLAVCGDGDFMMNSQKLETAVRLNSCSAPVAETSGPGATIWAITLSPCLIRSRGTCV